MIAIIFVIIVSIQMYRAARDNGRNAVLWTIAGILTFFGIQFAVGIGIGVFFGIGAGIWGWSETLYEDYVALISWGALIPSVIALVVMLKYVSRIRDDDSVSVSSPPPPPDFN